ncbi:MAG: hypothetical protein CR986_06045 [Ignavibacteriae bacterium]|nr:MAG: hypothetical protein CR986_06045 [Ignavibacteriota bacterium]
MKTKLIILFGFIAISWLVSCSSKNEVKIQENISKSDSLKYVEGTIIMVGNEPFVELALNVNDSLVYVLDCPKEMQDSLKQKQGESFIIYYSDKIKNEIGTKLIVTENKKIEKQTKEGEK